MSNYNGFCNFKNIISSPENLHTLEIMTKTLINPNLSEEIYCTDDNFNLGILKENRTQKFTYKFENNLYIIIFNGNLYNEKEIKKDLISLGINFQTEFTSEIVLRAYLEFGNNIFKSFNGCFSFVIFNKNKKELLLCRDHFGIKPLYYSIINNTLIFSTEIKSILKYPEIETVLDKQSICELFGIGPAHTPGLTVFKNIYELKPAHFAIFNCDGFKDFCYWKLETKEHTDNFEKTCSNIKYLLEDSIKKQIPIDQPYCAMLSGGIDSSILVAYISNYLKEQGLSPLQTLSVDYLDNDKNFVKSDFQPNSDNYYIDIMKNTFNTNHNQIIIDTPELAEALEDAMTARDIPGMADVDSSILLFCKAIKEYTPIAFSGECSDEIFAGYPWFFRDDALNSNTFPWSIAISERQQLLNENIGNKIDLKSYTDYRYNESIKNVEFHNSDSKDTKEKRTISYLTMNWFMQTLLDRADKAANYEGLEIRIPFCDYRIVEYLWNIPWEMKAYQGREKGLLRHMVKDLLPDEIVNRKKSPYPKTHNPSYLKAVKEMLTGIMSNTNAPINDLLNREYILNIINTDGKAFARPWFGQLMTGPQLMAYLCQVNMWLERYNPKIEIY